MISIIIQRQLSPREVANGIYGPESGPDFKNLKNYVKKQSYLNNLSNIYLIQPRISMCIKNILSCQYISFKRDYLDKITNHVPFQSFSFPQNWVELEQIKNHNYKRSSNIGGFDALHVLQLSLSDPTDQTDSMMSK